MKCAIPALLFFASIFFFSSATFGQTTPPGTRPESPAAAIHSRTCSVGFSPVSSLVASGTLAPYSAVRESSTVQTLADGTHITHKHMTEKIYLDTQGRNRTERAFCEAPDGTPEGNVVEIRDPVAGYSYILDEQNQVAYRFVLELRRAAVAGINATSASAAEVDSRTIVFPGTSRAETTKQSLGSQTMEGVMVEGTKTIRVIPEGLVGNDRPINSTTETWTSPDLQIVVLRKQNDPRYGELTMRLTNIDLSNPILSLFQPPADYKVVDETDHVTLTFTHN